MSMSYHRDAGTDHPDADATCWCCLHPVKNSLHDYSACHSSFRSFGNKCGTVKTKVEKPTPPPSKQEAFRL